MQVRRYPNTDVSQLPAEIPARLRQILARRGVKSAAQLQLAAQQLPHFRELHQVQDAARCIVDALQAQRRFCVCGDFDADGATSTALLVSALQAFGATQVQYLVPNRFADGYGLSPAVVAAAVEQGAEILITVDSGIACHAGVDAAKQAGMTVIVTDHHLPGEQLPNADFIVNPNQPDCRFPSPNIAGVGVAFYLLLAIRDECRQRQLAQAQVNVAQWLDLVALGTVADVVKLDHVNRILVQQGLARIKAGACRPGIKALLQLAGRELPSLTASDLGFAVGPRINAAGRLDDMALGIECLLAQTDSSAYAMAQQLDHLNRERRAIETEMREQAADYVVQISREGELPPILALYEPQWHQGVIGIVAGRVKEQYQRPVIAFAKADNGELKGSARSIPGLHIRDLLDRVNTTAPGLITRFGGHAMAAGLSLPEANFAQFQQQLLAVSERFIGAADLAQVVWSDGELDSVELSEPFVRQIAQYGPWGQGFAEPMFDGEFQLLSHRIVGERHLKLVLANADQVALDAIYFNIDTAQWPQADCQRVHCVYKLQLNHFRGRTSVQLLVEHLAAIG